MWLFGVFLHLAVTDWRFAFGRVGGTKSCQPETNATAGDKTSSLHAAPPDVKPLLAAGIFMSYYLLLVLICSLIFLIAQS